MPYECTQTKGVVARLFMTVSDACGEQQFNKTMNKSYNYIIKLTPFVTIIIRTLSHALVLFGTISLVTSSLPRGSTYLTSDWLCGGRGGVLVWLRTYSPNYSLDRTVD